MLFELGIYSVSSILVPSDLNDDLLTFAAEMLLGIDACLVLRMLVLSRLKDGQFAFAAETLFELDVCLAVNMLVLSPSERNISPVPLRCCLNQTFV